MRSTRKLVAVGAVLAITASGIALAETTPGDHSMGPDHMQHAMPSGQPMGPGHMQQTMRQHQAMMGNHAGLHRAAATPTMPGRTCSLSATWVNSIRVKQPQPANTSSRTNFIQPWADAACKEARWRYPCG